MDNSEKPRHPFTWERSIEIVKIVATVWVALVGTIVTMQFNERQHELNRIEAIAKMLPHLGATNSDPTHSGTAGGDGDMSRDGAIWAVFRTANNRVMLRDLASLFPEDIYRVVSSIAAAGGLDKDDDALTALKVSSEKLANTYMAQHKHTELSIRLYNQALAIQKHLNGDTSPLHIVELSAFQIEHEDTPEQTLILLNALNRLGEQHINASRNTKNINTEHWQAKQLFRRARQTGLATKSDDPKIKAQISKADDALADIAKEEGREYEAERWKETEKQDLAPRTVPSAPVVPKKSAH